LTEESIDTYITIRVDLQVNMGYQVFVFYQ